MEPNDKEEVVFDAEDTSELTLPVAKDGEDINWEEEAKKFQGMATRRGTKLLKIKNAPKPEGKKEEVVVVPKAGELDYGQKAFLIASGVKGEKETSLIQEALKSGTFKDLDSVLASKFIQGQLKELRDEAKAEDATPGESGRGGSPARNTKEYWLNKGEMPPNTPENKKLREEIVNAKISKDKSGSVFSKTPVVGNQ